MYLALLIFTPCFRLKGFYFCLASIALAEVLRRGGRRSPDFTRKFIHIGVGMWVIPTALIFETWYIAIIPPASFVAINAISYWRGTFKAMEDGDRENPGTLFFPISFAALVYYFWGQPTMMVAAMMPLTWGDAMSAILGKRYGHNRYTIWGNTRTLEGSLAMLFWSWIATFLALLLMPYLAGTAPLNWLLALLYSGAVALVCTIVEALSPWSIDNLTIPAAAALALTLLSN